MTRKLMRVTSVDYLPKKAGDNYDPDDLVVRVVGRDEYGDRSVCLIKGPKPHCWIPESEDIPEGDWKLLDVQTGYEGIDPKAGEKVPVKRLTMGHPKDVRSVADEVSQSFESDIPFYRRVTWDHGLSGYIRVPEEVQRTHIDRIETDVDLESVDRIRPRVTIGDIEVVDESDRGFESMAQAADAPINCVTWYDTYENEYEVIAVDPEVEVDAGVMKDELREHFDGHDLQTEMVEDVDCRIQRVETERDLLNACLHWFQRKRPDITAGWNWVEFDWYYLLSRMFELDGVDVHTLSDIGRVERRKVNYDRRGVESAVEGIPAFDQMSGLQKQTYGEWRSSALEFVASDQLGIGKIPDISVSDAYQHERSKLAAYNLLDVQLTVALTDLHGIEEFFLDLADLCGIQIQDTFSEKREVQGYIGRRRADDEVMPANEVNDIETPAGGLVLSPGDGIYESVAVLDLKSLYPSGMVTANISPETMTEPSDADVVVPGMPEKESDVDGRITPENLNWEDDDPSLPWSQRPKGFDLDEQGLLPKFAQQMFPEREQYKQERNKHDPDSTEYQVYDNRQRGVKVVHNSMYGVTNSKYFSLAKDGVGDAITGISRYILWRASEKIREMGYEVIYGDTDSVLVSLDYGDEDRDKEELLLDARGIESQLNDHMAEVADDLGLPDDHPFVDAAEMPHDLPDDSNHLWYFEFEKLYERFIQVGSKKRYAGTMRWKEGKDVDELDVTGFEAARSDQMEVTAEMQGDVIQAVLDGAGFSEVSEMVREQKERFAEGSENLHEIGVPWNLSKPLNGSGSYGNLPRARAARYSNQHLDKDYSVGDDFRGYYVRRTPAFVPETDVMALDWTDEIPEGFDLAREKTVDKAFESALSPIVEEMGWTWNEVKTGRQNQPVADENPDVDGDPFANRPTDPVSAAKSEPEDDVDEDEGETTSDDFGGAAAW